MSTSTPQLDQIAKVFGGHYEPSSGKDTPSGTHRLVFIGSIDFGPGHRILLDRCPRFTPKSGPGEAVLRQGDLVMPARGDRHDVALLDNALDAKPLVAASFLFIIRPDTSRVDPFYLAWWLNLPQTQARIGEFIRGSNMPYLPLGDARALKVQVPSLPVQKRIATYIRLSRREFEITTTLRELRSSLNDAFALKAAAGAKHE